MYCSNLDPTSFVASTVETVSSMFEVTWFLFLAAFTSLTETGDIRVVPNSLQGFKYGIFLSIHLGLRMEKDALATQLARFSYRFSYQYTQNGDTDSNVLQTNTVRGIHLKQKWMKVRMS